MDKERLKEVRYYIGREKTYLNNLIKMYKEDLLRDVLKRSIDWKSFDSYCEGLRYAKKILK
jgi:hypothetical protein|tara:strand:+ start:776 stop:958 length:183 start_codon:yes stop_codon:yes gene_type:complete